MDLTDIYRKFHLTVAECTFFLSTHGTFFRRDHMIGHDMSQQIREDRNHTKCFSDPNDIKLEINKRKTGTFTSMQKLNNTLLKNQWVKEEIKGNFVLNLKTNKDENITYKNL